MGKYVDKNDVLTWVNIQLRGKKILADIPDIIIDFAETKVDSELINRLVKLIPTESDTSNFLKFAAFCFSIQILCQSRMITQSHGDVLSDQFGEVTHSYQRANPMFFFAQGTARGFMALLPYETFRMYAYQFCEAYIRIKYYERTGRTVPAPIMLFDKTSGGYGFDVEETVYEAADAISLGEGLEPDIGNL